MLRDMEIEDLPELRRINSIDGRGRDFPDFGDPTYFLKKTLFCNERVIGIVAARLTSEIHLSIDPSLPRITKARELQVSFRTMLEEIKNYELRDTHIFVTPENDLNWADYVMKNFGFSRIPAIPLERWL